jgi:AraC-like DNA-binding protein
MYDPVKDGVAKTVESVVYTEAPPPAPLGELVHCFWELRTVTDLADDFTLHAVPDACVNLLFNQRDTRIAAATFDFAGKATVFSEFVTELLDARLVAPNPVTAAILTNLDKIHSVSDMAEVAALSPRQLQRALKATTGFTPHDLWKVLRVQHSFRNDYLLLFADQSHFTHSFRKLTGYRYLRRGHGARPGVLRDGARHQAVADGRPERPDRADACLR